MVPQVNVYLQATFQLWWLAEGLADGQRKGRVNSSLVMSCRHHQLNHARPLSACPEHSVLELDRFTVNAVCLL